MVIRLFTAAVLILSFFAQADQLAWNKRQDVERAVKLIQTEILRHNRFREPYYMVSYCSLCDEEYIEVWEVKKVVTVAIADSDYFEMQVFARCVLRSKQRIREGKYAEPVEYVPPSDKERKWFLKGIDMAYVYVPSGESFHCLGKQLQLDCDVHVEHIRLPKGAFKVGK